jgi:CheY-like chemotaxis protein
MKNHMIQQEKYIIFTATDGRECLKCIEEERPDLVVLGLTLPLVHGMDILKRIRSDPQMSEVGVIMSTGRALIQDYQAAIENGADYYLIKPFPPYIILKLAERFFEGKLSPAPFPKTIQPLFPQKECYDPHLASDNSYMKLWGTRGSISVSGPEYICYGGNTACMEICDKHSLIIIDAGTGIRSLGDKVMKSPYKEIHLIIGHTHWDHILGFPFFAPAYFPEYTIHIYAAKGFGKTLKELFQAMLDRDYFPVKLDEMRAKFVFYDLEDLNKPVQIGGIKIYYTYASHPGATLCFRIHSENKIIGYASDNEMLVGYHGHPQAIDKNHPLLDPYRTILDFYMDCDTLIHEAQYYPKEYYTKVGWGHSSISNATVLIKECHVKEWIVTHHDPSHTDDIIRSKLQMHKEILAECGISCAVHMAYDGLVFPL